MKRKGLLLLLSTLVISVSTMAQTSVSGNQSGIWTVANSPYEVTGDITVSSGQSLTIESGVEVNFQGYYKFMVQGELLITGIEDEMVLFTTNDQSTGWGGVHFSSPTLVSQINYCQFEHGKTGTTYPDMHGGAVRLIGSDAVFEHCIFNNNDATGEDDGMGGAVYAINTGGYTEAITKFINCKFINNHCFGEGGAIKFTDDHNSEIIGCEFSGNNCLYGGGAISFYSVVGTRVIASLFHNNYTNYSNGGAIHMLGIGNDISFDNCTFTGNEAQGGDAGAVNVVNGNVDFTNCIVFENPGTYSDDINIGFGGSAEINYCDLSMPDYATGSNNIEENPLFVSEDDFHLQTNSPCIDTGTDIGLPYLGEAPDMGCFEFDPVGIDNNQSKIISIFPNPSPRMISIRSNQKIESIELYDILGNRLLITNKRFIDLSQYLRGYYILQIKIAGHLYTEKLVKQ